MTLHLSSALHDRIDGGPQESPFTVDDVLGRIRRRRAVRQTTRGAVGLTAIGAVALGTLHLTKGSTPAEPTCGTDVAPSAVTHDLAIGRLRDFTADSSTVVTALTQQLDHPDGGDVSLGSFGGRQLDLVAVRRWSDAHPEGDGGRMRVLVVRDGEVVASGRSEEAVTWFDALPLPDGSAPVEEGAPMVGAALVDLDACHGALPAGRYELYVGEEPADGTAGTGGVAGPWTVDLLPDDDTVHGLPDGFPADDLPLPGGSTVLLAYQSEDGGWLVDVALDGDDALRRAQQLLPKTTGDNMDPDSGGVLTESGDWYVDVQENTFDGRPGLTYHLRPSR